jgi:hypothetical protein
MCVCDGAQLHLLLSSTLLITDICYLFLMPQWEFQVGPSIGIAADQLWAARYILEVHKCAQILKFLELYSLLELWEVNFCCSNWIPNVFRCLCSLVCNNLNNILVVVIAEDYRDCRGGPFTGPQAYWCENPSLSLKKLDHVRMGIFYSVLFFFMFQECVRIMLIFLW